ncbi:hypothetical protein VPH35_125046 [Triticum aestivum]
MRFPLLDSTVVVLFLVMFTFVDQIMDLVDWFKMTRLPSWEIVSSIEAMFLIGLSLFATHAEVTLGTVLNHMPRYQLVVSWEDLLLLVWKKPSTYLLFLETSLSLTTSAWPAKMVSVAAELAWMRRKRSKARYTRRCMMN